VSSLTPLKAREATSTIMASAPEKAVVPTSSGQLDSMDWPPASLRLRVDEEVARCDDALAFLQPMQDLDPRRQSWQPSALGASTPLDASSTEPPFSAPLAILPAQPVPPGIRNSFQRLAGCGKSRIDH